MKSPLTIKAYESTTVARTQELQKQIRDQAAIAEKILASFKSHLVEAEKTAQQVRDGLVKGSKAWDAEKPISTSPGESSVRNAPISSQVRG